MSLTTTVACISSSRNIYTVNDHATSSKVKKRSKKKRSFGSLSNSSSGISSSSKQDYNYEEAILYEISSRNCPCDHHTSARLRDNKLDSYIVNSFEASVAPCRGFMTSSSSNGGDSGINTNSNGSQRSSARGTASRTTFSISDGGNDSSEEDDSEEIQTTVILEQHDGCDIDQHVMKQRLENKACNNTLQKQHKSFQISPEIDPSNNWTLIKVNNNSDHHMSSIEEEEYDSLFSASLKTSHSSSQKNLPCACMQEDTPRHHHKSVQRMASWPKCHPSNDPHRFDSLPTNHTNEGLRQLPSMPPINLFWPQPSLQLKKPPQTPPLTHSQSSTEFNKRPLRSSTYCHTFQGVEEHPEIPPCVRNVILQQLQTPRPPTNPKMMKKLSKTIQLPDDPSDPTAFTVYDHPLFYDTNGNKFKSKSRRSRQVAKIVGTFSFFMTMGIVITVLCFLYWSDTFKPMTMM